MTRTLPVLVSLLAPLLAVAQMADQSMSSPAARSEINACALLTPEEISTATGLGVDAGHRHDEGMLPDGSYSSTCMWMIEENKKLPDTITARSRGRRFVILSAIQWPQGRDLARTYLEAFHKAAADGEIPSKPKPRRFGDEALWWGDGLAVRKGDVSFGVSVFVPRANSPRTSVLEERLVPRILQKLDQRAAGRAV